jgi:hypothetical protein
MALRPQLLAGLGLLALAPVAVFLLARGDFIVAFAVVNTLLIVGSVYLMFSPVEGGHEHDHEHATA